MTGGLVVWTAAVGASTAAPAQGVRSKVSSLSVGAECRWC